jgi:hypothetical protein
MAKPKVMFGGENATVVQMVVGRSGKLILALLVQAAAHMKLSSLNVINWSTVTCLSLNVCD